MFSKTSIGNGENNEKLEFIQFFLNRKQNKNKVSFKEENRKVFTYQFSSKNPTFEKYL